MKTFHYLGLAIAAAMTTGCAVYPANRETVPLASSSPCPYGAPPVGSTVQGSVVCGPAYAYPYAPRYAYPGPYPYLGFSGFIGRGFYRRPGYGGHWGGQGHMGRGYGGASRGRRG